MIPGERITQLESEKAALRAENAALREEWTILAQQQALEAIGIGPLSLRVKHFPSPGVPE